MPETFVNLRMRLPGTAKPDVEDERLVQLFRNRAELKKGYSGLLDERAELLDKLKKQEAATQRAKDQLDRLEQHLGNPEAGRAALAYFQLKSMWRVCAGKLAHFSQELRRQQEERERRRQLIEFDQIKRRRLAEADRQLEALRDAAAAVAARMQELDARLASLRGFWHYFTRRTLAEERVALQAELDVAETSVTDASDDRLRIEAETTPPFPGISTEGRRAVNTAVIAYAQQLVGQLADGGLAMLAKETTVKRVFDVNYGTPEQCRQLMQQIRMAIAALANDPEDLVSLKARTTALRAAVVYRSDADTVPLTDSIGLMPVPASPSSDLETTTHSGINVLVDDYWDLYKALLA